MADVARPAGVSSQTVSRVSNGQSNVDDATRARVLEAMQALGYRPNGAARALKSGRFHTIGVIMFTLQTFGNIRTLDAIATEAARAGYSVTAHAGRRPDPARRVRRLPAAVRAGRRRRRDHPRGAPPRPGRVRPAAGHPGRGHRLGAGPGYTVVDTDQAQGARQATEHLLDLGHRQVWHIAGPETSFSAAHRAESWQRTLREAGITPPAVLRGDWTATPATGTA